MPYAGKEGMPNTPPPPLSLKEKKRDGAEDTNLVQNLIKVQEEVIRVTGESLTSK